MPPMPIETRSNSAVFRRAEQLKRWADSETNQVPVDAPSSKKSKIKFSDGCVFLAACSSSDTDEVERLLKLGTDINTANVDGLTALHQACIDNNLEMVQFLVEHGCDVNRGDNEGWTPLHATASCGFLSIAKYLIENGANPAAVNNDAELAIDISEASAMEEYLSNVLDDQGIDCDDARSKEKCLMLEDAKLVKSNSIDAQDKVHPRTCATPLHVAAAKGYIDVAKLLIEAGLDLNAQDIDGWTPLHAAAHWGQKEACALLADSLANMDIQNLSGQTCFDVSEQEMVTLLEELKKKQACMQKDRPEIQDILQRTSSRPPFKRRTSVTRMSGHEKSKSVMKDTKSERAQIESIALTEEENYEEKNRTSQAKKQTSLENNSSADIQNKPQQEVKIPSWKKVLKQSSAESSNTDLDVAEVILKRPKKTNGGVTESSSQLGDSNKDGRYNVPPIRDDESELQRKAHAKRVRETRRSTQGVLLEDIKSAELQYLINTQQEAAKRQAKEANEADKPDPATDCSDSNSSLKKLDNKNTTDSQEKQKIHSTVDNQIVKKSSIMDTECISSSTQANDSPPSITLVLKPKSSSSPEETSPSESRNSLGTQAAIQRRRRPKRRSTGVVHLDSDDADKDNPVEFSQNETGLPERISHLSASSSFIPHDGSGDHLGSTISSNFESTNAKRHLENENIKYKKLHEELCRENEALKQNLKKTEDELEKTKKQLLKMHQNSNTKNSLSETDKKERRSLERKLSEMEEELKHLEKLKEVKETDNERLKDENAALIRVISKLSK